MNTPIDLRTFLIGLIATATVALQSGTMAAERPEAPKPQQQQEADHRDRTTCKTYVRHRRGHPGKGIRLTRPIRAECPRRSEGEARDASGHGRADQRWNFEWNG